MRGKIERASIQVLGFPVYLIGIIVGFLKNSYLNGTYAGNKLRFDLYNAESNRRTSQYFSKIKIDQSQISEEYEKLNRLGE